MNIEQGKIYQTRDNINHVRVLEQTEDTGCWYWLCERVDNKSVTFYSKRGQYDRHPGPLDLVEEV